jgi:hypothetical protein
MSVDSSSDPQKTLVKFKKQTFSSTRMVSSKSSKRSSSDKSHKSAGKNVDKPKLIGSTQINKKQDFLFYEVFAAYAKQSI